MFYLTVKINILLWVINLMIETISKMYLVCLVSGKSVITNIKVYTDKIESFNKLWSNGEHPEAEISHELYKYDTFNGKLN